MKYLIMLLAVAALPGATCKNNSGNGTAVPACIQERIDSIGALPRWNPPATVEEYDYRGQRVFLFSSDCCDQYNNLLDSSCRHVCAPAGGITGKGDGLCPDFEKEAKFVRLVWKDGR